MQVVSDHDSFFYQTETVKRRFLGGVESERRGGNDNEYGEQIVAEEHRCDSTRDGDDTERPVPISALRVMVVFSPSPFQNGSIGHRGSISKKSAPDGADCVLLF